MAFDNDGPLPQNRGHALHHIRRLRRLREIDADETARYPAGEGRDRGRCFARTGGTAIGEAIRHLHQHSEENHGMTAEMELLPFEASRSQLVREKIQPALAPNEWVICDRFFDSTTVYQGAARNLDPKLVKSLNAFAVDDRIPDLTFLLDINRGTAQARLGNRTKIRDRLEEESDAFHEPLIRGYRELAKDESKRVVLIDGRGAVVGRFPELGDPQQSTLNSQLS